MSTFLISYDLANPTANRAAINSQIMAAGQAWARPLAQTWYVRADCEAAEIETKINELLGDDDGLLVQSVNEDVVFANTALRWFRQRSSSTEVDTNTTTSQPDHETSAEIVPFPASTDEDIEVARAA